MAFAHEEIDPEAVKILNDAGFVWDPKLLAFRKNLKTGPQSAPHDTEVIDYEFLRDQQLVVGSSLDRGSRVAQLLRLRILLQSLN